MYAIPFPAIDPIALEFGPVVVRWYSLAYVIGLLFGWRYALTLVSKFKLSITRMHVDDFLLWATLGVIIGGRLGYVLFYKPSYFAQNIPEILAVWNGGMSFHGGAIGVLVATGVFCRKNKISIFSFGDLICAGVPIGLFFGRVANFINGELYGRQTTIPWGVIFPGAGPEPRHPSQLYEATLEGVILFAVIAVLVYRFNVLSRPGLVAGCFFLGYGISRFTVEFVREPDAHLGLIFGPITLGQILTIPLAIGGLWLIYRAIQKS